MSQTFPERLASLHEAQLSLRDKAIDATLADADIGRHFTIVQGAMDVFEYFARQCTSDIDLETIQLLGIRLFNDLGAAVGLIMTGYCQASTMQIRDALETTFLIDLFQSDRQRIAAWRALDDATRRKEYSAVKVRTILDDRDGFTERKRAQHYALLSGAGCHANPQAFNLLNPLGQGVVLGPFFEPGIFKGTIEELTKVAVLAAQKFVVFFNAMADRDSLRMRAEFHELARSWFEEYFDAP
ncbi:hypothetical protein ACIKTA_02780 [Hansschlegelia beijingensis]